MTKMRLSLQRVDDQAVFEREIFCDPQDVQKYVDDLNASRKEGEAEVRLTAAWQVGTEEEPVKESVPAKVEAEVEAEVEDPEDLEA